MYTRRYRSWRTSLLAALLALARTRAPASAFVLTGPRISYFPPPMMPPSLSRRPAGPCRTFRPPAGFCSNSGRFLFVVVENGGLHRDSAFNGASGILSMQGEGGGGGVRRMMGGCQDSGRQPRTSSDGCGNLGVVLPRFLTRAWSAPAPVPAVRRGRVRVNGRVNGGRSYGEINGSRDTANANSTANNSSSSSGTSGEDVRDSRRSPGEETATEDPPRISPTAFGAEQR